MPSHWLVIEPLLNRWDHNQGTSNQQARSLLPGITLDLGLWTCSVGAVGFRMTVTTGWEPYGRAGIRMTKMGLDAA